MSTFTRSQKNVPVQMFKKQPSQILDLPTMNFAEDNEPTINQSHSGQAETVTSNGIPLLEMATMNFEKPKAAKPTKPATNDDYMAELPRMNFDEKI